MENNKTFDNSDTWVQHVAEVRGENAAVQLQQTLSTYPSGHEQSLIKAINIANILLDLKLDNETLCAAMLYPALQQQQINLNLILESYGENYRKLLHDVMQMQSLGKLQNQASDQIENLRKMLLAMVTDVRAVLIILAERLWLLRVAKQLTNDEQRALAKETFEIYAPLANRLGVWQLKWEIEDLCLRYLEPETYANIAKWLASKRIAREAYLENCVSLLTEMLTEHHIKDFQITGRAKHIYSIYKKMQRKNAPITEIYDISAIRILVPEISDCYTVLSTLQSKWEQIHDEFDDYISHPKPNGYQSIHTVIIGPEGRNLEVQIRTFEMHRESELGVAAHWRYKEGVLQTSNYEAKIALLRQVMEWQKEVVSHAEVTNQQPLQDIFEDHIYVFTPAGDIVDMPKGATPLDFAYYIHSEVGHRCRGAKVNGKMVTLTHTLQTGERVEILTAKQAKPSRDWLNTTYGYLTTSRARAKVQHWFRVHDHLESDTEHEHEKESKPVKTVAPVIQKVQPITSFPSIQLLGINNLLTHVAKCCKPLPGNAIIGYITQNRGVSIHRQNCQNVLAMMKENKGRVLHVGWSETNKSKHIVDLELTAQEEDGIRDKITGALATEKINLIDYRESRKRSNQEVYIVRIEIFNDQDLAKAISALKKLDGIMTVKRRM